MSVSLQVYKVATTIASKLPFVDPSSDPTSGTSGMLGIQDKGMVLPPAQVADKFATIIGVVRWFGGGLALLGLALIFIGMFFTDERESLKKKAGQPLGAWVGGAIGLGSLFFIASFVIG